MKFLDEREKDFVVGLINLGHHNSDYKNTTLESLVERITDRENCAFSIATDLILGLEKFGVLEASNISINQSHLYYNSDIFLSRFFYELNNKEGNPAKAKEMVSLFGVSEILEMVEREHNSLKGLIDLIDSLHKKISGSISYAFSEPPKFKEELIVNIKADFKISEENLNIFIKEYIKEFKKGILKNPNGDHIYYDNDGGKHHSLGENYYPYETQKNIFLNLLNKEYLSSGNNKTYLGSLIDIPCKHKINCFEMFLALKEEGVVKDVIFENISLPIFKIDNKILSKEFNKNKKNISFCIEECNKHKYIDDDIFSMNKQRELKSVYNEKNFSLSIKGIKEGKPLKITTRKGENNKTRLLKTLFKEPTKEFASDEIYEDWGEISNDFRDRRTLDNAIRDLNKEIKIKFGIEEDFVLGNNFCAQINSKYL